MAIMIGSEIVSAHSSKGAVKMYLGALVDCIKVIDIDAEHFEVYSSRGIKKSMHQIFRGD